jgi:hypothetical protein
MAYQVGEQIQVQYLTDEWLTVTVAKITKITPESAEKNRKYYPDIKAGEDILSCSDTADGQGDIRNFYAYSPKVRHMDGRSETAASEAAAAAPPFEAKVETGEDLKPLQKIKLKQRTP